VLPCVAVCCSVAVGCSVLLCVAMRCSVLLWYVVAVCCCSVLQCAWVAEYCSICIARCSSIQPTNCCSSVAAVLQQYTSTHYKGTNIYIYIFINSHIHTCMKIRILIYSYIYSYIHTYIFTHTYIHEYESTNMFICIFMYT